MGIDFLLGGLLADLDAGLASLLLLLYLGIVRNEFLASLVWVDFPGLFAVGFVELVLGRGGLYAEQVVEGNIGAVVGNDFVSQAEDLVVCIFRCLLACGLLQTCI